jgi:oxygen-dependent protoporphyrinogen oxidase
MFQNKVIIVGAGCAGLSAAYALKRSGVGATVFEAQAVAGGRCRTVREDGYTFSIGAGSTEPQWRTTFQYLEELGLVDHLFSIQNQRYGFVRNGRIRTVRVGGSFLDMLKTTPENLRFALSGLPLKTYTQLLKVFRALSRYMKLVDAGRQGFEALSGIAGTTTEEFVLRHGGPEALEWLFHPLLATMVFGRPRDISIAHPIALFSLMKGMRSLEGGLGALTEALYGEVKECVRLSEPVRRVVLEKGRVRGVTTPGGFIEADQVICAVDAVIARELIPDLPEHVRRALATCRYSSTYYYQFGLKEHFLPPDTDFFVLMIPAGEKTILSWAAKGSRAGEKPVMIFATRGWEDPLLAGLDEEERRRRVIREAQRYFPAFPAEPVLTKVFRWDRAVNLLSPAQFRAIQDLLKNHLGDVEGLHLAGEYLFPVACTEGALATGKAAAEKVIEKLSIR